MLEPLGVISRYGTGEVAHFVPASPPGQEAIQINDVHVDREALIYVSDRVAGGVYILERT